MKATTGEEFDPSYLRLIRDRLEGNVPGAAELAALPFGLSGAFEEELSRWPVMERRPLLLWFGVFALSSKAIRLEWAESVLRVFDPQLSVDTESWRSAFSQKFNSAEPGEYALYHERFGSFVLQSIGQADVERLNAAIIHCCREAMEGPVDSFGTRYALRHGADHHLLVAGWKQDAGALENWLLNEEVWSAQFRLEGNWAIAMEGCRTGLKTAAKLKDRQRLSQFAVALRQLTVRDEECAEEALNLFREGRVEEAVQRVWNWDDDRLLIWVCLVLFDAKGLGEGAILGEGDKKAVHVLFSLLETRCSNAQANKVYPVDHLFGLLRWLRKYGLPVDWLLQRMSYTWDDLRDEIKDGQVDDLSIQLLASALHGVKWDRPLGLASLPKVPRILTDYFISGHEEIWQLCRELLTPPLIVKSFRGALQNAASQGTEQNQLFSLARIHQWLGELNLQKAEESSSLPSLALEDTLKTSGIRLLQPEEAVGWLCVFQEVVEFLLSTDGYDLDGGTPEDKGRLVQIFLHDAGWGVLKRMGADSPLFKVVYDECALESGSANSEQREMWFRLTSSSWSQEDAQQRLERDSLIERATLKEGGDHEGGRNRNLEPVLQLQAVAQRCKEANLLDVNQLEELGFDAIESLNGEAIRCHLDLVKSVGPPACDIFSEFMVLAYAKAHEFEISLTWLNRVAWSHRWPLPRIPAPKRVWETIAQVQKSGEDWDKWKLAMLDIGGGSFAHLPRSAPVRGRAQFDRFDVLRPCVDLVFRSAAFEQQDFVSTLLSGLAPEKYPVSELNSDHASLFIRKSTGRALSLKNEMRAFLSSAEQFLIDDDLKLAEWHAWLIEHREELQSKDCLQHVSWMCFDLGRYEFCLELAELFDVVEAFSDRFVFLWDRRFRKDEWRPLPESVKRNPAFRPFLWLQVSRVEGAEREDVLRWLWDTQAQELKWGGKKFMGEFKMWSENLPHLPIELQGLVVDVVWDCMKEESEKLLGLYARRVSPSPVNFSITTWSAIMSFLLGQHDEKKLNWLLHEMGMRVERATNKPLRQVVSPRSNASDMLVGLTMALSQNEPLSLSLVGRALNDARFPGKVQFGPELLMDKVASKVSVKENGCLLLNFIREMPAGRERGRSVSDFFKSSELMGNEDVLIAAKGLNVQDEGVVHVIPDVVMEDEDWEYALKWLTVSDVNSACLEGLIRALAFGERWEQVASPETAMRTPGLEELVDLGDWGYA